MQLSLLLPGQAIALRDKRLLGNENPFQGVIVNHTGDRYSLAFPERPGPSELIQVGELVELSVFTTDSVFVIPAKTIQAITQNSPLVIERSGPIKRVQRRRYPRSFAEFPTFRASISNQSESRPKRAYVRLNELSGGGLSGECLASLAAGDRLTFNLSLNGEEVPFSVLVLESILRQDLNADGGTKAKSQFRGSFEDMSVSDRAKIARAVEEHRASKRRYRYFSRATVDLPPVTAICVSKGEGDTQTKSVKLVDVSEGGIQFESDSGFKPRDRLQLRLDLDKGDSVTPTVTVIACTTQPGFLDMVRYSAVFTDLRPEDRHRMLSYYFR